MQHPRTSGPFQHVFEQDSSHIFITALCQHRPLLEDQVLCESIGLSAMQVAVFQHMVL